MGGTAWLVNGEGKQAASVTAETQIGAPEGWRRYRPEGRRRDGQRRLPPEKRSPEPRRRRFDAAPTLKA